MKTDDSQDNRIQPDLAKGTFREIFDDLLQTDARGRKGSPAPDLELDSGRIVEGRVLEDGRDEVTIRNPGGHVELRVVLTDSGPILKFESAALELRTAGALKVECDEFHVRAAKEIVHESGGDLTLRAAGDTRLRVQGELDTVARSTAIRSLRGDVKLEANDDVKLNGERVKLNC